MRCEEIQKLSSTDPLAEYRSTPLIRSVNVKDVLGDVQTDYDNFRHGRLPRVVLPAETFAKGRDFAAWLGLTPLQRSTGGKRKLGATSKMGERTLRRLLIIGSSAVVLQASKRGAPKGSWLEQMLARKPRMLVTVALANKTARIIWALLVKQENYRAPVAAKA